VIEPLEAEGHPVIAAANPLRGLAGDARSVTDLLRTVDGPVVLVGHSYGGAVISNVNPSAADIAGLVYVNGFAPDAGEACFGLAAMFPGSTLGETLQPVPRRDGTTDLYIEPRHFHDQFCADLPADAAASLAATQRPVTREALVEPSSDRRLWADVPSWFVFGEEDRIIPAALQHHMAARAHAQRTTAVEGASHALAVSRPDAAVHPILEAAALRVAA
jgi:pimeloyl-ACP methyl ester carboxylesterase